MVRILFQIELFPSAFVLAWLEQRLSVWMLLPYPEDHMFLPWNPDSDFLPLLRTKNVLLLNSMMLLP